LVAGTLGSAEHTLGIIGLEYNYDHKIVGQARTLRAVSGPGKKKAPPQARADGQCEK